MDILRVPRVDEHPQSVGCFRRLHVPFQTARLIFHFDGNAQTLIVPRQPQFAERLALIERGEIGQCKISRQAEQLLSRLRQLAVVPDGEGVSKQKTMWQQTRHQGLSTSILRL